MIIFPFDIMPERGRTIRLTRAGWLLPVERTRLQGTLLAVDEINAAGGIPDLPLVPV
jgi:ABC-type branched-subunit amino acid transport system substrate-binding protein